MLLVSFHGAKDGAVGVNNIAAYDGQGKLLKAAVLSPAPAIALSELRCLLPLRDGLLVVNANKQQNSILRYRRNGDAFTFQDVVFSRHQSDGLVHPFDLSLDESGNAYVSCQDTNLVLRFRLPDTRGHVTSIGQQHSTQAGEAPVDLAAEAAPAEEAARGSSIEATGASAGKKPGTPAAVASALPPSGTFAPGTFIASSVATTVTASTPVPLPGGLAYAMKGNTLHSVRGILWTAGALYVADQPACRVKVYDGEGRYLGQSNQVDCPIHLTVRQGTLWVSGGDQVFSGPLATPPGKFTLSPLKGVRVKNSSGLAFTTSGKLYVASRTENTICKFDAKFHPLPFHCTLPDNPEFLLHVQSNTEGS